MNSDEARHSLGFNIFRWREMLINGKFDSCRWHTLEGTNKSFHEWRGFSLKFGWLSNLHKLWGTLTLAGPKTAQTLHNQPLTKRSSTLYKHYLFCPDSSLTFTGIWFTLSFGDVFLYRLQIKPEVLRKDMCTIVIIGTLRIALERGTVGNI